MSSQCSVNVQDLWHILISDVCMSDKIVITFSGKWIGMTQDRGLDFVDCVMLLLDCSWSKVMVPCDLATSHIKLTRELFASQDSSGAAMGSHEELLSGFGVVGYANESSTNLDQLVQMFACVVCNNGYERDLVLCDQYVASFQLTPGV